MNKGQVFRFLTGFWDKGTGYLSQSPTFLATTVLPLQLYFTIWAVKKITISVSSLEEPLL